MFTSRRETDEEYRRRAGAVPSLSSPPDPLRRFRIVAGFAEHDERLGSTAEVEVVRETPPEPDEAVQLVWPAVRAETMRALGPGVWRPALNWVDVIEMRDGPFAVD